jgi:glycosyltransferase involved in cell wall biosynthesis
MRLAFISAMSGLPWGGSEELWSQAAVRAREQGHAVGACVADWQPLHPRLRQLADAGGVLHLRRYSRRSVWWLAWSRLAGLPPPNPTAKRARDWVHSFKPDLICISQGGNGDGLDWMMWCRQEGIPYTTITQSNAESLWYGDEWAEQLRLGYEAARTCFFVSEANRIMLEDQISARLPNATVVRNPFNVPYDVQLEWPDTSGSLRLACVARLEPPAKGHDLLLRVLAQDKWKERGLKVILYGAGIGEKTVRRLIELHGLKNVTLAGHVDSVVEIWRQCHALVLASRSEGLPLALVEAMLCSRPAIVTDIGGSAELCVDGQTGFLAAAPTIKLLDDVLERAWSQRDRWQTLGKAARARVEQVIPKDPIGEFCRQLLECGQKPN